MGMFLLFVGVGMYLLMSKLFKIVKENPEASAGIGKSIWGILRK